MLLYIQYVFYILYMLFYIALAVLELIQVGLNIIEIHLPLILSAGIIRIWH